MLAIFCFVLFRVFVCVCFSERTSILSCIHFEGECKNICGTQFSRYLFSARSYTVNYVYHLACLCFGIQLYKCLVHSYSFFGYVNATTHSLISSLA